MTKPNDPDPNPNPNPANDNSGAAITPAPQTGALASAALAALVTAFKKVDTTPIGGRPFQPLMKFKSREGGTWMFGQRRTVPEPDSLWAVNPLTFTWGWVCWNDSSKILGERMVSVTEPLPDAAQLPPRDFEWQKQMGVNMKCVSGIDAGAEVMFKTNTRGGIGELSQLVDKVRDRLTGQQHDGKVVPVVKLENSSYPHDNYGKTYVPVMTFDHWMSMEGPVPASEPTPTPPPPPTEQPRRRRVG